MEVRETAACGVAEREFAIELMEHEIVPFYKFLVQAKQAVEGPDPDLIDEMAMQIHQIVGPALDR